MLKLADFTKCLNMKNQFLPINYQVDLLSLLNQNQEEKSEWESITEKEYKKQKYIYHIGDEADDIYILKSGRVKIEYNYKTAKTIIKNVLTAGDLFGEISLTGENHRIDSAITMENTELYVLSRQEFYRQMKFQNNLGPYIINLLGARIIAMEHKVESYILKTSRTRIVDFLSDLAENRGKRIGFEILVDKFFTHKEIADITSTSRQGVTAILNELRNKNILTFNRRRLLIRDLNLLRSEIS